MIRLPIFLLIPFSCFLLICGCTQKSAISGKNYSLEFSCPAKESFDCQLEKLINIAEESHIARISGEEHDVSLEVFNHPQFKFNLEKLMNLLSHKSLKVRALAAYTLWNLKTIPEKYFDKIKESSEMGNTLAPYLLSKIGNEQSIKYLAESFKKNPTTFPLVNDALMVLGEKAVPYLLEYFNGNYKEKEKVVSAALIIFKRMRNTASSALPQLRKIAANNIYNEETRVDAIETIAAIKRLSEEDLDNLKKLRTPNTPKINETVENLLFDYGDAEALMVLMDKIEKAPECFMIRDLAEKGEKAKFTGERLLTLLDKYKNIDDEVNICIVRAIGYIGYISASRKLELLAVDNDKNWVLVYVVAETLGKLKSKESLPFLENIAQNYWYEPVRITAKSSIDVINCQSETEMQKKYEKYRKGGHGFATEFSSYDIDFYDFIGTTKNNCQQISGKEIMNTKEVSKNSLQQYHYKVEEIVYGYNNKDFSQFEIGRKMVDIVPKLGIKVDDGFIVGSNRGEFGGEIQFVVNNKSYLIINDNPVSMVESPKHGYLAACGSPNRGIIYKIFKSKDTWHAEPWIKLPDTPKTMKAVENGIYIETERGKLLIDNNGKPVECK